MSLKTGSAVMVVVWLAVVPALGQTLRDDFDVAHDYSTGNVPGGSIWTAVHNPAAGGGAFDAQTTTPGSLTMGTEVVGWGGGGVDTSRALVRTVDSDALREVRLRISAQSVGTWSMAGTIIRKPGPVDGVGANDNFATFASFRVGAADTGAALGVNGMSATVQNVTNGGEAEMNSTALNLTEADLTFLRLVHLGTGDFQTYASADGTNWGDPIQTFTNGALAEGLVEVGLWGGNFLGGDIPGAMAAFDWIEIELGPDAPEDMAIWDTANTFASWHRSTWVDEADNGLGVKPDSNVSVAVFGDVLNDMMENVRLDPSTIYTNTDVTAKELRFETDISYTIGGAGSITLASNTGTALINVNEGTHEIQADLILANNTTATAASGAVLNVNAGVDLDGNTLTLAGAGMINLNNGVITGGGQVNGAGNLAGLGGVVGDYTQASDGSLAVVAGGSPINISGTASLAGTLDVALADGVSLAKGDVVTVLSAGSVSDLGLSLGAGASLFDLLIDGNSVSLVAAVPEPSTLTLLGAMLGFIILRRRRRALSACAALLLVALVGLIPIAPVQAQCPVEVCGIFIDEFDGATHDYTTGMVPVGGIWDGIHNPTNGGDQSTPAILVSNGSDFFGNPRPGVLFWEELVLHPNTDGQLGTGWEGNKTSAPFLFRNIPAENDFVATVKINSQTSGTWSYGGIIARHAGPTPGQTVGDDLDPEESFITAGSFRTNPTDDPETPEVDESQNFTVLRQNIINTAETEANGGGGNGIPTWIRLEKVGGQFTSSWSIDGENFTAVAPQVNPELNVAGETLEVGVSYMTFGSGAGAIPGEIEFDSFEIEVTLSPTPTVSSWSPVANGNGSGNWNNANNWTSDVPGVIPGMGSGNKVHATLGNVLPGPSTVGVNDAFELPKLTIDSPHSYAIAGSGSIALLPNAESLTEPTLTRLEVLEGSHEIQVDLSIAPAASTTNNNIVVAPGAELNLNSTFVMNNKQVLVSGGGRLNINNNIDNGAGTLIVGGATVGGSGRVNGALTNGNVANPGGTVAPGTSVGRLTVDGTYNQHSSSTLEIELGGTGEGEFDVLAVQGLAILDGFVDVSLVDGFVPDIGDMFTFLTATTNIVDTNMIELVAEDDPYYDLMRSGNSYILQVMSVPPPPGDLDGDYNNDGVVNAADYVLWRNGGPLQNDPTPGVQPGDYDVWVANFGMTAGAGASVDVTAVPEPGMLALALFAAAVAIAAPRLRKLAR